MNKYLALQKQVFDISKVTVVGSPTITSDGVASGFSASSYLQLPEVFNTDGEFEIILKDRTPKTTPTSSQYILSYLTNGYGMGLFVSASNRIVWGIHRDASTYNDSISGKTLELDTDYLIKLSYKNNIYSLDTSNDGITWINQGTKQSDVPLNDSASYTRIGVDAAYNVAGIYTGSIDLPSIKIYVDNKLVFQPVKPAYLLERRKPMVWDKEQFTVVGSPVISDSGVASGFSTANYLNIPVLDLSSGNFTIETTFKFTPLSKRQIMWRCATDTYLNSFGFLIGVTPDNKLYTSGIASDTTYNTILTEGLYTLKLSVQNGTAKVYLDGNLIINGTYNKTISTAYISIGQGKVSDPWLGSINLKQFKIYTDGNLVFDGGADTYVYDASKFTVVGSPTITEYGVASGFSLNNCLMIDTSNIDWTKPYKIKVKVNTGTTAYQNGNITCYNMPIIRINDRYLQFSPSADFSSISTLGSIKDTTTVSNNTDYYLIASYDGTIYKFEKSLDDINYTTIGTSTTIKTNLTTGSTSTIGNGYGVLSELFRVWSGSINLPSISITVDGKEVFTGAKENFYMLRR